MSRAAQRRISLARIPISSAIMAASGPRCPAPTLVYEAKQTFLGWAGGSVTILAEVKYKGVGSDGKAGRFPYPDKWLDVVFQRETHQGRGPFTMDLKDVENYSVVLRAVVGSGKTVKLDTVVVQALCGAKLPADLEQKELVCTLFSEGGSRSSPALDDKELYAIAWSMRNRFEALARAKVANDRAKWAYFAGRWYKEAKRNAPFPFSHPLSYSDLVRGYKQYTGVDGKQYNICADPLKNVDSIKTCRRVQKCVEVIDAVFGRGGASDPYQGKGNAQYPGVFYYKEKGNNPPHPGPLLPELTGDDHHFNQGLDETYAP